MATWERYKEDSTGLETKSFLGDIFAIRSYCDVHGGGVYDAKEPICKLLVAPLSVFINVNFSWDISQSGSETDTLDTYDIDFDGATSGGDISGAAWAGAKTGTNQYTAAGHFTIVASVTDTLGNKSKEVRIPVIAIDGGDEVTEQSLGRVYIPTTDSGCWIWTPTVAAVASNTGLAGDDLKFRQMKLSPYTADGDSSQHLLLAATKTGLAYSLDGTANWLLISRAALGDPKNDAGDGTPPVTADLDQVGISFDPQSSKRWYATRTNATRTWLYWSDDSGMSWDNEQVNMISFGSASASVFTTSGNVFKVSHVKLDTDKSIAFFTEFTISKLSARVIDSSGASPAFGTKVDILADGSRGEICEVANVADRAGIAYCDELDSDKGKTRILTVAGTTITVNAATIFDAGVTDGDEIVIAITEDGSAGCIAYTVGSAFKLCRITISGVTITADAPVSQSAHPSNGNPMAMTALDNDRLLLWYYDIGVSDLYHIQVIDVSSTIAQSAVYTFVGYPKSVTFAFNNCLTALSNIKAVVTFRSTGTSRYLAAVDIDAENVVTLGTIETLADSSPNIGINKINSSSFVLARAIPSKLGVYTYKIGTDDDGSDILELSGAATFTVGVDMPCPIVTGGKTVITYQNTSDFDGYAVMIEMFLSVTHSAGGIPGSILV